MSTFTLDNLRKETQRKFEPVTIEIDEDTVISLPSVLRLGKKDREAVADILGDIKDIDLDEDDEDSTLLLISTIGDLFKRLSPKARKLLDAIEEDDSDVQLSILAEILNAWFEGTQPGEA